MKNTTTTILIAVGFTLSMLLTACGDKASDADNKADPATADAHAHDHGANGGHLIELGTAGHLEILHDLKAGTIALYLTGPDAETPVTIAKPPVLKLVTADGPKILQTLAANASGESAEFHVKADILKTEPENMRVSLEFQGKTYNPSLGDHDH
ncbi:MAG: hypothetical protein V3W41_08310 [Planctomycetota bacterium]